MWSGSAALYAICIGYAAVGGAHPVAALTLQECSAKYGCQLGHREDCNLATFS
jgi:hypothetical protein